MTDQIHIKTDKNYIYYHAWQGSRYLQVNYLLLRIR